MNELETLQTIAGYEKLVERAREVAATYLALLSGPRAYQPKQHTLEAEIGAKEVYVRWWHHGDYDAEYFPTRLLWGTDEDIAAEATAEIERRRQREEELRLQDIRDREARDLATYERLKLKFESNS